MGAISEERKFEILLKMAKGLDSETTNRGESLALELLQKAKKREDTTKEKKQMIKWYTEVCWKLEKEYGFFETVEMAMDLAKDEGVGTEGIVDQGLEKFMKEFKNSNKELLN